MAQRAIDAFDTGAAIGHPGENGRAREEILRRFLREVVPPDFGVETGFVIDAAGGVSRQIDIVIYRHGRFPVLDVGGVKHFLVESVAAVLEVKAAITSATQLTDALVNVASVKALDRTNSGKNRVLPLRTPLTLDVVTNQVFAGIVTGASLTHENCLEAIVDFTDTHPRTQWPNTYVDVKGFQIAYTWNDNFHRGGDPMRAERITAFAGSQRAGWFAYPLAFLAVDLLDFLRVTPVIEYSTSGYFYRSMLPLGPSIVLDEMGHSIVIDDNS
jgi:hypothetical protein